MVFGSSRNYSQVPVCGFFEPMASTSALTLTLFKDLHSLRYATLSQGWAIALFFAKKSERAICSFCSICKEPKSNLLF